jgi:hypothetical protein
MLTLSNMGIVPRSVEEEKTNWCNEFVGLPGFASSWLFGLISMSNGPIKKCGSTRRRLVVPG